MPKYKCASGCYNKHDAREFGLAAAVVWNDIIDRAEHFDSEKIWYDQGMASERLGIPQQTISRSLKTLEEAGRINVEGGYRPNSSIRTTWVTISKDYLDDNLITQNGYSKVTQNGYSILNETEERDLEKVTLSAGSSTDSPNNSPKDLRVVYLRVNPSGKKGAWKSQKVYSTKEEVDRLDEMGEDDYIDFKHWKSPNWVGDEDRAKFKRMKVKLVQPDVIDEDEVVKDDGKKYKKIKGGVCY